MNAYPRIKRQTLICALGGAAIDAVSSAKRWPGVEIWNGRSQVPPVPSGALVVAVLQEDVSLEPLRILYVHCIGRGLLVMAVAMAERSTGLHGEWMNCVRAWCDMLVVTADPDYPMEVVEALQLSGANLVSAQQWPSSTH